MSLVCEKYKLFLLTSRNIRERILKDQQLSVTMKMYSFSK